MRPAREAGRISLARGGFGRAVSWRGALALLAVAATMGPSSCSLSSGGGDGRLPRIVESTVVVTMKEYRIDYRGPVPSGRVVFRIVNGGRYPHRLSLVPLPKDLPPLDKQLHGRKRRIIPPLAGVPELSPGASNSFAVDLVQGQRYGFVDFSTNPDGRSNALLGLNSEFRAGGGAPGPLALHRSGREGAPESGA